ncbi:hypothetical protein DT073_12825 [Microbacterium sp. ABRD28]|nr:hypothetical protein DT073_12825 [Microbacterium sp. ABRD28]
MDGELLEGALAFDYLVTLREALVVAASDLADEYHSASWLELLRLLNPAATRDIGPYGADADFQSLFRVAENLVGSANGATLHSLSETGVPTAVSMRLARLLALAGLVDDLEGAIRSSTKGATFRVYRRRRPRITKNDELRDALAEFDLRNRYSNVEHHAYLDQRGTYDLPGDPAVLAVFRFPDGFALNPTWTGAFRGATLTDDLAQFTVRVFTTGDPTNAVLGQGALDAFDDPDATAAIVVFGHALLRRVLERDTAAGQSLTRYGTLRIPAHELESEVAEALEESNVSEWLSLHGRAALGVDQVLRLVDGMFHLGRRSYPGPILHSVQDDVLVDVWALSWHMTVGLRIDPSIGGALVNASAEEFELVTQSVIDGTPFAPPPDLRKLRGRTLRLAGAPITDVDALVVVGRKLFLISCKRVTLRVDYLAGDYRSVRNAQSRVDSALDEWSERIRIIRGSPIGDNYDFTGYEIDGFVVVPELVYSSRAKSRELLRIGVERFFFTRVESLAQLTATLTMASNPSAFPRA